MKLKYTYIFFLAISVWIVLRSDSSGRTTATPPNASCASAGCHNTANAAGVTTIDSISLIDKATGLSVTQYVPGQSYRLGFVGKYVGAANLSQYGFIIGNGGKGTFSGTSTGSVTNISGGVGYWGHNTPKDSFLRITVPTTATFYFDTCTWTAPAAGSGTVTFSGYLNAVNSSGNTAGDRPSNLYSRNYTEINNTAGVAITINGSSTFCAGTTKTFTANPTNGGTSPTYQWYLNGTTVGTGGTTYTTSTLSNNDSVWVVMTSNLSGVTGNPATSNKIKVTIPAPYVNNVTIVANKASACAGDTVIFTATSNGGATGTQYRWYRNQTQVQGNPVNFNNSPTFQQIGLNPNDSFSCRLQVNNACATPVNDTSNYIKISVNPSPVISPIPNQSVCAGGKTTAVYFNSSMTGTTYTWTNTNTSIGLAASGTTDSIGSFTAINNTGSNQTATITVRSFAAGCSGAPVSFNITVRPSPVVRKPIVPANYCAGASGNIIMTTIPIIGPTISWTNDNTLVGIGASGTGNIISFTAANTTNDSLVANITARATQTGCTGPDSIFRIVVYPKPTTNAVSSITLCDGNFVPPINFSSNVNGATYSWTNSDPSIGLAASGTGNISSFQATNTSGSTKVANLSVTSKFGNCNGTTQNFSITVTKSSPAEVNISSKDTIVCPGASSFFSALPTNGGTTPTYQWYRNGVAILNGTKDTITINNIANNDVIKCVMNSNSNCVTTNIDTSNEVTLKTISSIVPKLVISSLKDTICEGDAITINTTPTNGGTTPAFQWYLNGTALSGANSNVYLSSSLKMNNIISCELTSSLGCANPSKVSSNELKFKVFPVVATQISMTADKSKICSDEYVTFTTTFKGGGIDPKVLWTLNGQEMNTNVKFITIPINSTFDIVKVEVKSGEVCPNPRSMIVSRSIDTVLQGPYIDYVLEGKSGSINAPNKYIAFCEGDSIKLKILNGQPSFSYLWNNGLTTDSFWSKSTNTYTLKVSQTGNVCPRYYGPFTTNMNALPSKPEIQCNEGIIRASFSDKYQWQLSKLDIIGADSQTYKINIRGNYRVKVTNSAGCSNYSDEMMLYPLSINSGTKDYTLSIYPNPSNGVFHINSKDKKIQEVVIYDLSGKIIYTNDVKEFNKIVKVEDLPKGNYIIQINTENNSYKEKIEVR